LCWRIISDSVSDAMSLPFRIGSLSFRTRWMKTRFPFKYGIASMTELPHVFGVAEGSLGGAPWCGLASEGLPPKWFTKNPDTCFEEDLPAMVESIRHACDLVENSAHESVFAAWRSLHEEQDRWAREKGYPPLLAHLGTALVERMLIDGYCRGAGLSFPEAVGTNSFGIDLGCLHPELAGTEPGEWLAGPGESIVVRHTVGLGDPLRAGDIPEDEGIDDGLPHALLEAIRHYGLTHFKIKVCGSLEVDVPRLKDVAAVLSEASPGFRYTLDGNEQFRDIATFREHWEAYRAEPGLAVLFESDRLLFVEQPLHRDVALAESVRDELAAWDEAPSMIIDESDGELDCMRRALALGYRGTSHKNCKGVIKGLANRCLIEWYRRQQPEEGPWLMSGEDLANVGPVALLNDLAAMAVFGIGNVERNGHHYFAGLSMFPGELQKMVCERHPDLYEMRPEGYASLRIEGGRVSTRSPGEAPFGHGLDLTPETLALLGDEGLPATT